MPKLVNSCSEQEILGILCVLKIIQLPFQFISIINVNVFQYSVIIVVLGFVMTNLFIARVINIIRYIY